MALPGLTFYRDILRKLTTTEADNNIQILSDAIEAGSGLSDEMPDGQIYIGDNTNTASLETLDTSIVPDTTDKRYQTDNQKLYNDATSSIQTQLNSKAIDTDVLHKTGDETATGIKTFSTEIKTPIIQSDTSAGTEFKSNGGTSVATWGAGGGAGWTFKGGVIFDTLTVSTLAFINSSKQLISATGALLGTWVQTLTTKTTTIVDADTLIVNDSESSFEAKKLTFGNLITYIISKILPSLTSNYYPKWDGSKFVNSYISENTSAVYTKPYPTTTSTPTGTGSFSGGLKWLDNGTTIAGLYIYKPYVNGNAAGWYPILDAQNPTFPAFSLSTSAVGIQFATMSNSYSTAPTNTYNPEIKFITVGNNRGIGVYQGGSGYQFLNPYNGKDWVCLIGNNGYLRDWDGQIIASTANGGKGNGNSTLVDVLRSWNTKIRFRAMVNTNSPYYFISGVVSVDSNGNCTNLVITQPSSNTTAFNATITSGKLQFTSNGSWDACTVFCEKLTAIYGNQYSLWETNETFDSSGSNRYWNGSLGVGHQSQNASAIGQFDSTTKGFLPPRMTTAQRTSIASPAIGLMVYCTDATEGLYIYKSTGWTFII